MDTSPTRRGFLRQSGLTGATVVSGTLAGCVRGASSGAEPPTVRVGSKPFTEQRILGYLAIERLRSETELQVVNEVGYGDSLENWRATSAGEKHVYWEYTGTAWTHLPPERSERITDPDRLYDRVRVDALEQGIRMGPPAPFSNGYVLVADSDWVDRTGVTSLSELATYLENDDADVGIALGEDFYHREDGWAGLVEYYSIDAAYRSAADREDFVVTSVRLPYALLDHDGFDLGSGFETDRELSRSSLVVLDDDRGFFLPYQPAPAIHARTAEAHPQIERSLRPVAESLDTETMRSLNRRVDTAGSTPRDVARSHLEALGRSP